MHDFRLPPRFKGDLRCSGMLHNVGYWLFTDVSNQLISPVLKGQAVKEEEWIPFRNTKITIL